MSFKKKMEKKILQEIEWKQKSSTPEPAFSKMQEEPDMPTPKAPQTTPVRVVPESVGQRGGHCAILPMRVPAPHHFNNAVARNVFMGHSAPMVNPALMYSQQPMWSCVTYNQEGAYNPPHYNNMPMLMVPASPQPSMQSLGYMNGPLYYKMPVANFAQPEHPRHQPFIFYPNVTQQLIQQQETQPYIKKPLNAFMIFRKEQRPIVMAEHNIRDSATVNSIVGQKWKCLTKDEQDTYYKEAEKEKQLHALQHPDWSSKFNYGRSKFRNRKAK